MGPFPPGARVNDSALATDLGPLRRTTVTPTQAFEVNASKALAPAASMPPAMEPAAPGEARTPLPHAPVLVAAALLGALTWRRGAPGR